MFKKLKTYWFILNHILEITDGISTRVDRISEVINGTHSSGR